MICETIIAQGLNFDCQKTLTRGFEPDGVIINKADIESITAESSGSNLRSIVLKDGSSGYPVKQPTNNPFDGSAYELNVGTYVKTWTKNIQVVLMSVGNNTSKLVDDLTNANAVLILKNKTKLDAVAGLGSSPGTAKYEIIGLENGAQVSAGSRTPNDENTLGGTLLTLTETGAGNHGLFLWAGSEEATDAAYSSLLPS